jgi:23S rRNA (guanosine2251-2'-O)-methyltransferase
VVAAPPRHLINLEVHHVRIQEPDFVVRENCSDRGPLTKSKKFDPSLSTLTGYHGVREALRASPERVRRVIVAEGRSDGRAGEILELARSKGVPVYREKTRVLDRLTSGAHHQGVVAEIAPIPMWSLEEMLSTAPAPALLVALDRIEDPRNFGSIARTADSTGVHGILIPKRRSAPPSDVAVAASAGALLHMRLARVTNLTEALKQVQERRIWVVGLSPDAPTRWHDFDYTVPVLLVLGSEGRGLGRRVAEACDQLVSLPQRGRVESLNVSVAAGVVLYEVLRQRMGATFKNDN